MSKQSAFLEHSNRHDLRRRAFTTSVAATFALGLVPYAAAQPVSDAMLDAFLTVSKVLTGRPTLDVGQAARLHEALVDDDGQFQPGVQALLAWMNQRKIALDQLQHTLDAEQPMLAALPGRIVSAWYTGVVGEGARARCITFETSLMHVAVADRLSAPSYCYGPYGRWVEAPA